MITKRTISIVLLVWRTMKITEDTSENAVQCVSFIGDQLKADLPEISMVITKVAGNEYCKTAVLDGVRAMGISLATLASAQRHDLLIFASILLTLKLDTEHTIQFAKLPDVVVGVLSLFGVPTQVNIRKRGIDGRFASAKAR